MAVINFAFREKLNAVHGGEGHDYCFQCGACVGDCPAARYSPRFNPRVIMLRALLGLEEELLGEDSVIWECTNCCNCYERCPQDVKPVDVVIALKNLCAQRNTNPPLIRDLSQEVLRSGRTAKVTSLSQRRREELGLTKMGDVPVDELRQLLASDQGLISGQQELAGGD
jgi:heterodisulfide reductase subunit C